MPGQCVLREGLRETLSRRRRRDMCILFFYHALGEQQAHEDGPPLASMDFSAAGKNNASSGHGHGRGRYKLIVASNRDEDLQRPTTPIHFWEDANSNLLAGRDLVGGGTWLGVSRSGRFATVTNIPSAWDDVLAAATDRTVLASKATAVAAAAAATVAALLRSRPPGHDRYSSSGGGGGGGGGWAAAAVAASLKMLGSSKSPSGPSLGLLCALCAAAGLATAASVGLAVAAAVAKARRSRGGLVADFLKGDEDAQTYCSRLSKERRRYAGFNLVLADPSGAWVLSNRDEAGITHLPHGFYGVSNATLDTPWPKMVYGKSRVLQVLLRMGADPTLTEDALVDLLMDVLADDTYCPPQPPPSYGQSGHAPGEWANSVARVCVPPTSVPGHFRWPPMLNSLGAAAARWLPTRLNFLGGASAASASASATPPSLRYATRSSTVVLVDATGRMKVVERNLVVAGEQSGKGGSGSGDGGKGGDNGNNGNKRDEVVGEAEASMLLHMRYGERNTIEFCDV